MTALHVITSPVCNGEAALQPVITERICNEALQDGLVITCNEPVVTPSLGMSAEGGSPLSDSVTGIESNYVTPVLTLATDFDEERSVDDYPTPRCPSCGSDFVMMTLLARGEWQCWEDSCCAIWIQERRDESEPVND
jgi:hypothetical protein